MARKILLLIASSLLALAAVELAARALRLQDRDAAYPPALLVRPERADLPYALRPGARASTRLHDVRVNSLGMRGAEPGARMPGRERILLLGDSIVFGHQQEESRTVAARLEHWLREAGRDVEVLNGGVSGYDTSAEAAWLESVGLLAEPDLIVLGVSLNDFDPAPILGRRGQLIAAQTEAGLGWLERHSEAYPLLRSLWSRMQGVTDAELESQAAGLDRLIAQTHKQFYRDLPKESWQRVLDALDRIARLARSRGIALSLVIFPERDQLETGTPDLRAQQVWTRAAIERGLPVLDLWSVFRDDGRGAALFSDVQHPNETGIDVAARAIAEWLAPKNGVGVVGFEPTTLNPQSSGSSR